MSETTHKPYGMSISLFRPMLEKDEMYLHLFEGKHGGFRGRRYRRGKNRCSFCGAPKDSPSYNPFNTTTTGTAGTLCFEKMAVYS